MDETTIALTVMAVLAAIAGVAVLLRARSAAAPVQPRAYNKQLTIAEASTKAASIVNQAAAAAQHAREVAVEELTARREAVESFEAVLEERERHLRERRAVFDERRFAFKKRRDEMTERSEAIDAQRSEVAERVRELAALDPEQARAQVLDQVDAELAADGASSVERAVAETQENREAFAATRILEAIERQTASNVDSAPRLAPVPLEGLDDEARERLLNALSVVAEKTSTELGVDMEKAQATLRGVDPVGREIARQAALELIDRKVQAEQVPPLLTRTASGVSRRVIELGERALWEMRMSGRPELAELMGTLHFRFSYGQNALLHCEETGFICGVLAAELGLPQSSAREAGMLHDVGKAVDHAVEGAHAIIGGELLRVLGVDSGIVHAVKAHHFDEEPSTELAMLTICADAISASRPGARRDTLAAYLARLEQLQTIATRHDGVDRAYPLQAGRELRVFVKASSVKDGEVPALSAEIAREIESEMQYPGLIKVTVIRETTATATAPAQIVAVREAVQVAAGAHAEHAAEPPAEPQPEA
ncbi:MAG TPA: Rnase Y domain-containing protein [Candidatus Dormibacteraeota bacterium]|nr:Rnase Y domain-containing protein [Candidatus Dormibacteraeota bacterium]